MRMLEDAGSNAGATHCTLWAGGGAWLLSVTWNRGGESPKKETASRRAPCGGKQMGEGGMGELHLGQMWGTPISKR